MAEKIYRIVSNALQEIGSRDGARRYRYKLINGENAYVEYTDAEETQANADAAFVPPYLGPFRVQATRVNQNVLTATPTPIDFLNEVYDLGSFHDTASNQDRFVVPTSGAGIYDIKGAVRFNEASALSGANVGDRVVQVRVGGAAVVTQRQRAAAASDTEIVVTAELVLAAGDVVRMGVLHVAGVTMQVDARFSMRRVD